VGEIRFLIQGYECQSPALDIIELRDILLHPLTRVCA
jgi:hypothetical protein